MHYFLARGGAVGVYLGGGWLKRRIKCLCLDFMCTYLGLHRPGNGRFLRTVSRACVRVPMGCFCAASLLKYSRDLKLFWSGSGGPGKGCGRDGGKGTEGA